MYTAAQRVLKFTGSECDSEPASPSSLQATPRVSTFRFTQRDKFQSLQQKFTRKVQRGFSLLELLIVVAIILILAAVSVPNFMRTRMAANEVAAAASLREINTACFLYLTAYGAYPPTLASLGSPSAGSPATAAAADLLDSALASGNKSGYVFTYTAGAAGEGQISTYTIVADPTKRGATGQRGFFTDQTGVIRANPTGTADANSAPID
jgi:prepilin-type N-terminal cleavage/methylation domain-containing protein